MNRHTVNLTHIEPSRLFEALRLDENPMLRHALTLAVVHDFPIFPLVPGGKTPLLAANWHELATTHPADIIAWWMQSPQANIAIATDGLIAVDVDPRHNGHITMEGLRLASDWLIGYFK